MILLMQLHLQ